MRKESRPVGGLGPSFEVRVAPGLELPSIGSRVSVVWGIAWLVVDLSLLAATLFALANIAGCRWRSLETWGLFAFSVGAMLVMASGMLLGIAGRLNNGWWTVGLALTALAAIGWAARCECLHLPRWRAPRKRLRSDIGGTAWQLGIGAAFVASHFAAAAARPLAVDDLAYRLPRIGVWLQDGTISSVGAENSRIDFMAVGSDLIQAWIVGHFDRDFPLSALLNWAGAWAMAAAAIGWARTLRLPRRWRGAVAAVVLTTPIVFAQATTQQNDLFVAGLLAAGLSFLWRAHAARQFSFLPALAFGTAIASKSTALLLGPAVAVGWLGFIGMRRPNWGSTLCTGGFVCLAVFALAGPRWAANWREFGHPLWTAEAAGHVAAASHGETTAVRTIRNGAGYLIQNLAPSSNPPFLARPLASTAKRLVDWCFRGETASGSTFMSIPRRSYLDSLLTSQEVRMESLALGLSHLLAGMIGIALALAEAVRTRRVRPLTVVGAMVLVVALTVSLGLLWQPWAYRFVAMAVPLTALLAVTGCAALRRWHCGALALTMLLTAQFSTAIHVWRYDLRSGYRAVFGWSGDRTAELWQLQRALLAWAGERHTTLHVALSAHPEQTVLAGFFRAPDGPRVRLVRLDDLRAYSSAADYLRSTGANAVITETSIWPSWESEIESLLVEFGFYRWSAFRIPR